MSHPFREQNPYEPPIVAELSHRPTKQRPLIVNLVIELFAMWFVCGVGWGIGYAICMAHFGKYPGPEQWPNQWLAVIGPSLVFFTPLAGLTAGLVQFLRLVIR